MTNSDRIHSDRKGADHFWQRLIDSVGGIESSRRLAAGVALGMTIGLVPNESLVPYVIGVLLILSPANLLSGLASALFFGVLANFSTMATLFDQLGIFILSREGLTNGIAMLYQYPLMPWLRIENSIVLGSTLFCLMMVVPVYLLSERWFAAQGIRLIHRVLQIQLVRRILGVRKGVPTASQGESLA